MFHRKKGKKGKNLEQHDSEVNNAKLSIFIFPNVLTRIQISSDRNPLNQEFSRKIRKQEN